MLAIKETQTIMQQDYKIIIIGAGPAGLAMAGRLTKNNITYTLLEKSNRLADSWHKHYDRLHLHTVKDLSSLPYKDFPKDYPTYVSKSDLIKYYKAYAEDFDIHPVYHTEVVEIKKHQSKWRIKSKEGQIYEADKVIVATGTNRIPYLPELTDQATFRGDIIHSTDYKNPNPYKSKNVLVIGMGNTGAEISLDLAEQNINTFLSVRGPVNIVPRDLNGRPVQTTSKLLDKFPFGLGDWIGGQIRKIYFGDLRKYGLETSKMYPVEQLKKTGKTPVIDIGTIAAIKKGAIKVVPEVEVLSEYAVQFKDGSQVKIDTIICATGFRSAIDEFVEEGKSLLDQFGHPGNLIAKASHEGLYFIGYDNYKLGGILGTIKDDSLTILEDIISGKMK